MEKIRFSQQTDNENFFGNLKSFLKYIPLVIFVSVTNIQHTKSREKMFI